LLYFVILFVWAMLTLPGQPLAGGRESGCISEGWPHEVSDLQPDPEMVYGKLENGFRYVIMKNNEPKNRAGLYLNIQAGSLNEKEEQRGLAHFLEHMLFNGTENYPPGTLVKYFQSIGMRFGADTNAHTNFNETVYNILLPATDRKHLDEGLLVMADYAGRALLLEEEVDRERGIILAEKRTRDSVGYRMYKAKIRFFFAGTRVTERLPIGTEETLNNADAELLRDFYTTWYRPENIILVVVGNVDTAMVEELISRHFGRFTNPDSDPSCYDFGRVDQDGTDIMYLHEPELGHAEVALNTRWNEQPGPDSLARHTEELEKYVAASLLNNRLKRIVNRPDSPITNAQTYSGVFLQRVGYATVTARLEAEKWRPGLELLTVTLRQAIEEGFSEQEFARVRKEITAELEKQVKTKESRDSRKLAGDIIGRLNSNRVPLSPEQELELYTPILASLSVGEVNRKFRSLWARENRQIFVGGTAVPGNGEDPEAVIGNVYDAARQQEIQPWRTENGIDFPYLPVPSEPGAVTGEKHFPGTDVRRVRFANGTVVNVKKTDFQPNEVRLAVHFGRGKLSEPRPGLAMLAEAVVRESGLGRMTRDELDEALAGSSASLSFGVGEESFVLDGRSLTGELELLFQLAQAQVTDPAFREEAYSLAMERTRQMYDQLRNSVEGMMRLKGERFLAGGNPHYGLPPQEEFAALDLDEVRQWVAPELLQAGLEINVVGDVDPEEIVALAGRYFGNAKRNVDELLPGEDVTFPAGGRLAAEVETRIDKAMVVVAWPTDDFWDISRTRRLNALASVFGDRVRVEIREKLGAVYSPAVFNRSSRVADGYGVLMAMLTVDPLQADDVAAKVREVAEKLAETGVTREELHRAMEPTLTSIKDMMRTNNYWLQSVLALSSRHPEQLEWPLTIRSDFASITTGEVAELAARYLVPSRAAEIVITPAEAGNGKQGEESLSDNP
jgi:zinc protease